MQSDSAGNSTEAESSVPTANARQHSSAVGQLYDKLFSFEVKKAKTAYPIHKKLNFSASEKAQLPVSDIYHWLGQQLPLADFTRILDAGCGVGFGCQTLTHYTSGHISGISLSQEEVSQAQRFASDADMADLSFAQASFEDLPADSYDCILMVESLKHCSDLHKALSSVAKALQPGGAVYVVEDVYQQTHNDGRANKLNEQLCLDWHLKKLWNLQDFAQSADKVGLSCTVKSDLTPLMGKQMAAWLQAKIALFSVLSKISGSSVFPVYRGGFILDWLYSHNKMRYQLLELKKKVMD